MSIHLIFHINTQKSLKLNSKGKSVFISDKCLLTNEHPSCEVSCCLSSVYYHIILGNAALCQKDTSTGV